MISFIVCSVLPYRLEELKTNIKSTIGSNFDYEIIAFDNREYHYGIAKIFNQCAEKAQFENLCFLHEDIAFRSQDWGDIIEKKLQDPNCGIIGFTGSPIKFKSLSSTHPSARLMINHYIQRQPGNKQLFMNSFTEEFDYQPCITIDGMCMFVRKNVWRTHHFDEKLLPGFHGYDLDFSLQVAEHFQNYICGVITVEHFSLGKFSTDWVSATIRLHQLRKDVPPVDKGILMLYNTGSVYSSDTKNSILSYKDVEPYLCTEVNYPLPLDYAFPAYEWSILFRGNQFHSILRTTDFPNTDHYKKWKDNKYEVIKATNLEKIRLWKKDIIYVETSSLEEILKVKKLVRSKIKQHSYHSIIYHLDGKNLSKYTQQEIDLIYKND